MAIRYAAPTTILPPEAAPSLADEMNHRVANSLQLLAAMVSIEARQMADPAARAVLDTMLGRIAAIASVHRQLYRPQADASVELGAYLKDLAADLALSHADAGRGRHIRVAAGCIHVSPAEATTIGLIASELVINACKYAYEAGQPGDVWIILRVMPSGSYMLEVSDEGRGIDPADEAGGDGLGNKLVAMMANRLAGRIVREDAQPGTRILLHVATR